MSNDFLDTLDVMNKTAATTPTTAKADKPKAVHWINVGMQTKFGFIKLPLGIGLDTMLESTEGYDKNLERLTNSLLRTLKKAAIDMERGVDVDPATLETLKGIKLECRMYSVKQVVSKISDEETAELEALWEGK